jgi:ANTAR domain/GAF domain
MADRFDAAAAALREPGDDLEMARRLIEAIPVTGASVSTLGPMLGTETLSSTDQQVARLDELQFDLGEGPCWEALATGGPVFEPALQLRPAHLWPAFLAAVRRESVGAMYAFPLGLGPLHFGAIDLYDVRPRELSDRHAEQAAALAEIISRRVLRSALERAADAGQDDRNPFSRRAVQQATGYVIAQLGVTAQDAELLLQGRAFVEGRSVREVAEDVLTRRSGFRLEVDTIEDSE